jgi:hypothetical protein
MATSGCRFSEIPTIFGKTNQGRWPQHLDPQPGNIHPREFSDHTSQGLTGEHSEMDHEEEKRLWAMLRR